jgi:hypothetical protein
MLLLHVVIIQECISALHSRYEYFLVAASTLFPYAQFTLSVVCPLY